MTNRLKPFSTDELPALLFSLDIVTTIEPLTPEAERIRQKMIDELGLGEIRKESPHNCMVRICYEMICVFRGPGTVRSVPKPQSLIGTIHAGFSKNAKFESPHQRRSKGFESDEQPIRMPLTTNAQ